MIEELGKKQNKRVVAIKVAREVLSDKSTGMVSSSTKSVDTIDLVSIAEWIMDGKDPWKPKKQGHLVRADKPNPAYPYGICKDCGFGLNKSWDCYNPDCTSFVVPIL